MPEEESPESLHSASFTVQSRSRRFVAAAAGYSLFRAPLDVRSHVICRSAEEYLNQDTHFVTNQRIVTDKLD